VKHKILVLFEIETPERVDALEVASRITDQFDGPAVHAWIADENDIVDGKAEMNAELED
jgi:hypothetical protein